MIKVDLYSAELELLIKHRKDKLSEFYKLAETANADEEGLHDKLYSVIQHHQNRLTVLSDLWKRQQ